MITFYMLLTISCYTLWTCNFHLKHFYDKGEPSKSNVYTTATRYKLLTLYNGGRMVYNTPPPSCPEVFNCCKQIIIIIIIIWVSLKGDRYWNVSTNIKMLEMSSRVSNISGEKLTFQFYDLPSEWKLCWNVNAVLLYSY